MRSLVLSSVRHNRGRYLATLVAIIAGVAFFAATGFVSGRVIDVLEGDVDRQFGKVDVAVVYDPDRDDPASGRDVSSAEALKLSGVSARKLRALPGVEGATGTLTGKVAFLGDNGRPFATDAVGSLTSTDPELDPLQYVDGRAPRAAGEISVDRGTAEEYGFALGDRETVLTLAGQFPVRVVGITSFGSSDSLSGGPSVGLPAATAFTWLNGGREEYEEFYLRVSGDPASFVQQADRVVPEVFHAQTGADLRADKRDSIGAIGRSLRFALQGFALLALLVGGFVIFNTFSVIVAQRLRELAVLSAIGATPKQLKRSLRMEGLVIGLIGSTLGVLVGVVLTFGLIAALEAFGVELPGSGISLEFPIVFQAIVMGTVITVVAVSVPARRAARTEPIEALRDAAVESGRPPRRRAIIVAVLLGLGLLGLLAGPGAAAVGGGAIAFAAGAIVAGPYIALGGARLARPAFSRFGIEGRLAADNSARNPQRTATTANALVIGVFLVTLVTVAGTSAKDFAVGEINKLASADYLVQSEGGTIDPRLVTDLERIDGVATVAPFRNAVVTEGDRSLRISTGDLPTLEGIADLDVESGDLADLRAGTIAIVDDGGSEAPRLGSTVKVTDNRERSVDLRVVALLKPSIDAAVVGSFVERGTFDRLVGDVAPTVGFVDLVDGAETSTRDAIERRVERRPDITLQEGNALGRLVGTVFDFLINAVIGLLLMSVVIALIGIVNTLSLSILERRRELGLLRIIGMTDDRVRRMVRLESVLIAGLGTVTGLVTGLVIGISLVLSIDRLSDADIALSLPIAELVGVLGAGVVLGVLAALIPARRSTRLEVLDAIGAG